jgi:hypothetical protein
LKKIEKVKKVAKSVSKQVNIVLNRYQSDLEAYKSDDDIDQILKKLKVLAEDPDSMNVREFYSGVKIINERAQKYRRSHSGWFRKRWGASNRLFKLTKNLELTAYEIYHKKGNKEKLLELYAKQVNDLKLAAKAYMDYKYSYCTEDQTKEPGKNKLNKQDRKKLNIVKRVLRSSFSTNVPKQIKNNEVLESITKYKKSKFIMRSRLE